MEAEAPPAPKHLLKKAVCVGEKRVAEKEASAAVAGIEPKKMPKKASASTAASAKIVSPVPKHVFFHGVAMQASAASSEAWFPKATALAVALVEDEQTADANLAAAKAAAAAAEAAETAERLRIVTGIRDAIVLAIAAADSNATEVDKEKARVAWCAASLPAQAPAAIKAAIVSAIENASSSSGSSSSSSSRSG